MQYLHLHLFTELTKYRKITHLVRPRIRHYRYRYLHYLQNTLIWAPSLLLTLAIRAQLAPNTRHNSQLIWWVYDHRHPGQPACLTYQISALNQPTNTFLNFLMMRAQNSDEACNVWKSVSVCWHHGVCCKTRETDDDDDYSLRQTLEKLVILAGC